MLLNLIFYTKRQIINLQHKTLTNKQTNKQKTVQPGSNKSPRLQSLPSVSISFNEGLNFAKGAASWAAIQLHAQSRVNKILCIKQCLSVRLSECVSDPYNVTHCLVICLRQPQSHWWWQNLSLVKTASLWLLKVSLVFTVRCVEFMIWKLRRSK
jgi:hypothetical protein